MRAREFIPEKQDQRTDEILPVLGALGGALVRGGAMVGGAALRGLGSATSAAARGLASAGSTAAKSIGAAAPRIAATAGSLAKNAGGAAMNIGKQAIKSTVGNAIANAGNQAPPPVTLPANTKIEPIPNKPGDKSGSIRVKIGDAEFVLDDPKALQQLGQLGITQ